MIGLLERSAASAADLRRVAFHEAGHATVARALGIYAHVSIWASGAQTYAGTCTVNTATSSAGVSRAIFLAGAAAEVLSLGQGWASESEQLAAVRARLSASDIALAGPFSPLDLRISLNLCRKYWTDLARCAAEQIEVAMNRERVVAELSMLKAATY